MKKHPPMPRRDSGGSFTLNNLDDGTPIADMLKVNDGLLIITEKVSMIPTRLADFSGTAALLGFEVLPNPGMRIASLFCRCGRNSRGLRELRPCGNCRPDFVDNFGDTVGIQAVFLT